MKKWARSEANGFSGAVWVLRCKEDINLKLWLEDKFFLHFRVGKMNGVSWEFTAIYASSRADIRKKNLVEIGCNLGGRTLGHLRGLQLCNAGRRKEYWNRSI